MVILITVEPFILMHILRNTCEQRSILVIKKGFENVDHTVKDAINYKHPETCHIRLHSTSHSGFVSVSVWRMSPAKEQRCTWVKDSLETKDTQAGQQFAGQKDQRSNCSSQKLGHPMESEKPREHSHRA